MYLKICLGFSAKLDLQISAGDEIVKYLKIYVLVLLQLIIHLIYDKQTKVQSICH